MTPGLDTGGVPGRDELTARYASARLTTCLVKPARASSGTLLNALGVLVFETDALAREARFITRAPLSLGDHAAWQLMVVESTMSVGEAAALVGFQGSYVDPAVPDADPVTCPGEWSDLELLGADEQRVRGVLPAVGCAWLQECRPVPGDLVDRLGATAVEHLVSHVRELLGVDMDAHRDRLGAFLVLWPETRLRVWWRGGRDGAHLGVVTRVDGGTDEALRMRIEARRQGEVVHASLHPVREGPRVLDLGAVYDEVAVEVFDGAGRAMYRQAGRMLRMVALSLKVGPTVHEAHIGGLADWEQRERAARRRQEREALLREDRLFLFRGQEGDPRRAREAVRRIIGRRCTGFLYVLDPYLEAEQLDLLLPALRDQRMDVRLLTALQGDQAQKEARRTRLLAALETWRKGPRGRLGALACRLGAEGRLHDRFIISQARCWQLGSSLNSLGTSLSTIIEMPYPELVKDAFESEWDQAVPCEER